MVTFLPDARYNRAVAANAGVYVMPDYSVPYPLGLKDSPLPKNRLPDVFARKLIIMSGGSDTNPNDTSLANFPGAEAQGSTRFERAKTYFATAQAEAAGLGVPLDWEYYVVRGSGTMRQEWPGRPQRCSSTAVEGPGQTRKWVKCRPF